MSGPSSDKAGSKWVKAIAVALLNKQQGWPSSTVPTLVVLLCRYMSMFLVIIWVEYSKSCTVCFGSEIYAFQHKGSTPLTVTSEVT